MTKKTRLTINIDDDILEILKTIAKEDYITTTALARKVLSEYCRNRTNNNLYMPNLPHDNSHDNIIANTIKNNEDKISKDVNEKPNDTIDKSKANTGWSSNMPKVKF